MKNIDNNKTVGGIPAVEIRDWHKQTALIRKLVKKRFNEK